jgi:hypothetical protein
MSAQRGELACISLVTSTQRQCAPLMREVFTSLGTRGWFATLEASPTSLAVIQIGISMISTSTPIYESGLFVMARDMLMPHGTNPTLAHCSARPQSSSPQWRRCEMKVCGTMRNNELLATPARY